MNSHKASQVLIAVLQVASIIWAVVILGYYGLITGAITGSGLFGIAPSSQDVTGFMLGVITLVIMVLLTKAVWKRQWWQRILLSLISLAGLHVLIFGIFG